MKIPTQMERSYCLCRESKQTLPSRSKQKYLPYSIKKFSEFPQITMIYYSITTLQGGLRLPCYPRSDNSYLEATIE